MHLLSLKSWSTSDLIEVIENGIELKNSPDQFTNRLIGKTIALLFQKTSTRTRCAGEIGMMRIGGNAVYLDWRSTNFGLADLRDEMRVLSSYADLILARFLYHDDLVIASEGSTVPLINGCCDRYHPTQAIGDLMTIQEKLGRLEGVKLTYVGVHNNVCNSLICAGMKVGMEITIVTPEVNPSAIDQDLLDQAEGSGTLKKVDQLSSAINNCDIIYTDTWIDMEFFGDPKFQDEKDRRIKKFMPYQLNHELIGDRDLLVMHCLPAHRGYEISGDLIGDERSVVFDQAENRMHSMSAILLKLANG